MKQAIPPFASARRYAFSRGLVPGIDAFCTQAIAHASLVGENIPITRIDPDLGVLSASIAFHEKAGRSQVGSLSFRWTSFSLSRVTTVANPSFRSR